MVCVYCRRQTQLGRISGRPESGRRLPISQIGEQVMTQDTMEKEKIILVPRFGDGSKGDRIPSYMHWQWDSILAWGHKKTFRTTY